jgi:two-component sensor histidine kinase
VAQIQSIATVHGLQAQEGASAIEFSLLVSRIVETMRVGSPIPVTCIVEPPHAPPWSVPPEEAVPLAIAIGELLMNAVKHTPKCPEAYVEAQLIRTDGDIELCISNTPAHLPEGFKLSDPLRPSTGLDLVQALLPRERADLMITQKGTTVRTRLHLRTEKTTLPPS